MGDIEEHLPTSVIDQGTYTRAYTMGIAKPRHLPPAIRLVPEVCSAGKLNPFYSSLILWEVRTQCPCCGNYQWSIVAIWDFNFDRCMDFNYAYGVYVNARQIEEGIAMYQAERASSHLFEGDGIQ